jgi:predicted ABC-type ATPase
MALMQLLGMSRNKTAARLSTKECTLSEHKPALFIIAGPLGAGKTTFYEAYLEDAFPTLVPTVRAQQRRFLDDRRSFAVEDIRVDTQLLDDAKAAGYTTKVLFISTEDANLNFGRILVRMRRGGKAEPVSSVVDSYQESPKNLTEVCKHTDELVLYDNTPHDRGFRVVAQFISGELRKAAQTIPDWAAKVFDKELHPAERLAKTGRSR